MDVAGWVWTLTLVAMGGLLLVDLAIVARRPHEPSMRESTVWVSFYVGLATAFAVGLWYFSGGETAGRFAPGWLTE
jgi:tellurite resistance protein TerC